MKSATIGSLNGSLRDSIDAAQSETLLICDDDGEPLAVLSRLGVDDGSDAEFWVEDDPEVWELLRRTRDEPTIPFDEVLKQLAAEES
jgi:hypothetical protein